MGVATGDGVAQVDPAVIKAITTVNYVLTVVGSVDVVITRTTQQHVRVGTAGKDVEVRISLGVIGAVKATQPTGLAPAIPGVRAVLAIELIVVVPPLDTSTAPDRPRSGLQRLW